VIALPTDILEDFNMTRLITFYFLSIALIAPSFCYGSFEAALKRADNARQAALDALLAEKEAEQQKAESPDHSDEKHVTQPSYQASSAHATTLPQNIPGCSKVTHVIDSNGNQCALDKDGTFVDTNGKRFIFDAGDRTIRKLPTPIPLFQPTPIRISKNYTPPLGSSPSTSLPSTAIGSPAFRGSTCSTVAGSPASAGSLLASCLALPATAQYPTYKPSSAPQSFAFKKPVSGLLKSSLSDHFPCKKKSDPHQFSPV